MVQLVLFGNFGANFYSYGSKYGKMVLYKHVSAFYFEKSLHPSVRVGHLRTYVIFGVNLLLVRGRGRGEGGGALQRSSQLSDLV